MDKLVKISKDRPTKDHSYKMDPSKAEKALNWRPKYSIEEGLKKTIAWYIDNQKWMNNVTSGDYQKYYNQQYS